LVMHCISWACWTTGRSLVILKSWKLSMMYSSLPASATPNFVSSVSQIWMAIGPRNPQTRWVPALNGEGLVKKLDPPDLMGRVWGWQTRTRRPTNPTRSKP
jgi:hypothetical protein